MSSLLFANRLATKAPVNPLDKSTLISIYPREINVENITIQPGKFSVPSGSYEKPGMLVIGPSSWWKDVGEEQPLLEIPVSSVVIADSIVNDWCKGLLAFGTESKPGFFFLPGEVSNTDLKVKYKAYLDKAASNQKRWYGALVQMADTLWSRTNGNPLGISDDMRLAARELGLNTKEWLANFQAVEMVRCFACGNMKNPSYPVCPTCRAIDPNHPKSKEVKFAS
jgi:hypothetical protein